VINEKNVKIIVHALQSASLEMVMDGEPPKVVVILLDEEDNSVAVLTPQGVDPKAVLTLCLEKCESATVREVKVGETIQ
jgi:hypothetical protein